MRLRSAAIGIVGLLLAAAPAFPQTITGTISGNVVDGQGGVLPGVVVTVASPNLQGTRSVTTSANGDYIFPFLPPGDYTVTFELAGFQTVKDQVRVTTQAVPLNATLNIAQVTETLTVVGQAPGDFGQTATVSSSYKTDLVEKLPTNRTLNDVVRLAPNVQASGPQGSFAIAGAMSYQNLFSVNGVVIQDNLRGTPFTLFIEDAIQETTIRTGAISAEYGRFGGGVADAITKSGGNEFSGSFRTTFDNDKWRSLIDPDKFRNDSRTDKVIPTYEATLGGPLVKDKLWFFGAGRIRNLSETLTTSPLTGISYPHEIDEKRYEGKLTYSITPNHTVKGSYIGIKQDENGNSFNTILDLASLVNRQTPQKLFSANYSGILSPRFFVEAQYARRNFSFENSGATLTDLIGGTLMLDQAHANARYHAPTFCGVCGPEKRDNSDVLVKASYFLSTSSAGSHNLVFGFDAFNDQRFSNNHQSGSDFRLYTTNTIIRGTEIFPVIDSTSFIRWTPIFQGSQGNNFKTLSGFVNDAWRVDGRLSFNVGVRFDKNDGKDSIGRSVVKDSAFSPRLSVTYDPNADGKWTLNGAYAKYVTAIANGIGDSSSPGGQPATIDFAYGGPTVNLGNPASPISQNDALQTVFGWFNANGGTNRGTLGTPSIPGLTSQINSNLASPSVVEYTVGVSRRLGNRGLFRIDGTYRKFQDFYGTRTDVGTGKVTDTTGKIFDLAIVQNTDAVDRNYKGVSAQISYKLSQFDFGGNYTLSQTHGSFDGETGANGPVTTGVIQFPEYKDISWNSPEGDLATDVRHRARGWLVWEAPMPSSAGSLSVSALEFFATGSPYGALGTIDDRAYVSNPGYQNPPASVNYYFTARDAFRTENTIRTDFSVNYSHDIGITKKASLFFRGVLQNAFNRQEITNFTDVGCGTGGCIDTTVTTRRQSTALVAFNPFTQTPVQGVNWKLGDNFGKPTSRYAFGTPRTMSFSVGFRF